MTRDTKPIEIDAETQLQLALVYFRSRLPAIDLEALEKFMRDYAALVCNEHLEEHEE